MKTSAGRQRLNSIENNWLLFAFHGVLQKYQMKTNLMKILKNFCFISGIGLLTSFSNYVKINNKIIDNVQLQKKKNDRKHINFLTCLSQSIPLAIE